VDVSFNDAYWERELRRCGKGALTPEDELNGFVYWCEHYAYIEHPKGRRLLALREAQLLTAADYLTHDQVLILKARQIGFTTLTMNYALWRALFFQDWSCINLSRRQEDAEDALGKAVFAYNLLPDELRERLPKRTDRGVSKMTFTNGSKIESHPSAGDPARGRTVSLIIVDEWASFPNPEEAWASIKPTFDIGGKVIALSTAKGAGSLFHTMWVGAETGSNSFHPIFFSWRAVPERDDAWYEVQKRDLLPWILHQEFPTTPEEAFIKSGNPVFDVDALRQIPVEDPERGYLIEPQKDRFEFRKVVGGELAIWEHPEPGVTYCMGADVAEGLEHGDYSVAWVINTLTGVCAAKWRGHIDPDLFGSLILRQLGWFYNGAFIGPEVNNHGYATCVALRDSGYPNIYYRQAYDDRTMRPTSKIGWRTQLNTKPLAIDELHKALREGEIRLVDKETIGELVTFVRDPDGKMHGSPFDDQVIGLAIANMMRHHAMTHVVTPKKSNYMTAGWLLNEVLSQADTPRRVMGAGNVRG
jgi:hypothetical protein